jgi:hypothetical protein
MRSARTPARSARSSAPADDPADTLPMASGHHASRLDQRMEVCPPSLFSEDDAAPRSRFGAWLPTLGHLRGWLASGWMNSGQTAHADTVPGVYPESATVAKAPVQAARHAFISALADVQTPGANDLVRRAQAAVSLRELWHLRNELFTLVSITHCESIGHQRLGALDRFFPVRSPANTPRRHWPFLASARHESGRGLER